MRTILLNIATVFLNIAVLMKLKAGEAVKKSKVEAPVLPLRAGCNIGLNALSALLSHAGSTPFFNDNSLPLTTSHFSTCPKSLLPLFCLLRETKYMNQRRHL
jgi:hypothetical protein